MKFITYAVWWVRESMTHVLADQTRAFSFPPKLFSAMYRGPGGGDDVSLSDPVGDGRAGGRDTRSAELGDMLAQDGVTPIEETMIHQADLDELTAALGDLDGKEREVVRLRFGLDDDRAAHAAGDRRPAAPVARARAPDRIAREGKAAPLGRCARI